MGDVIQAAFVKLPRAPLAETRRYTPADHAELSNWWTAHNLPIIPPNALPVVGFMVQGVAAGFLYQTDSDVALVENFISNPASHWDDRQTALDSITQHLIDYARFKGRLYLMAMTQSQAIFDRALHFGFKPNGAFHVLNLDLSQGV